MRHRSALLILLVSSMAGCAGPAEDADTPDQDPILHTRPGDFNGTTDPDRFHLHDYWMGASQLLVMQEGQRATLTTIGTEVNRLQFRPPSGSVVPLGTANVTVTLSWEEDPGSVYGPVHLYVKTQAVDVSQDAGTIQNGVPLTLPSTNEENDLPHQLLSAWSFDLYLTPDPESDLLRFNADVEIDVIATRGLPIPLFPPHPDHWKNATSLALFDEAVEVGQTDHPPAPNSICTAGCLPVHVPDNAIVPPGSDHVRVVLRVDDDAVGSVALAYHGADTREWTRLRPDDATGTERTYRIPTMDQVDGPYAATSLWEFRLETEQEQDLGSFYGGYRLAAQVLRADT